MTPGGEHSRAVYRAVSALMKSVASLQTLLPKICVSETD
jgi:hypothetical protein